MFSSMNAKCGCDGKTRRLVVLRALLIFKQTRGLVPKETVVLSRWGREKTKFWIYQLT